MHLLDKFRHCPACGSSQFAPGDFKSKRCQRCGFTYYFNAAAAVVAIITNERGEVLVARRGEEPAKGTLDLIGGFVDPGESSEQAVLREIEEETGLHLAAGQHSMRILFTLPNTYLYSGLLVHSCDCFFHFQIDSHVQLEAHDDVADCWWMKRDDIHLDDIGLDSVREGLRRFLAAQPS